MPMLIRRVPGDCRRAHHFLRRVRTFIKHLKQASKTCSAKAFLLEIAESTSGDAGELSSQISFSEERSQMFWSGSEGFSVGRGLRLRSARDARTGASC